MQPSKEKTLERVLIEEFGKQSIASHVLPRYILDNLNPDFELRPYQETALKLYRQYIAGEFPAKATRNHQLLFHMATGSGKTLIMAALILDLYQRGFRDFLFFVNSTNIIDKTKDNFLNQGSSKYLFSPEIFIEGSRVSVNVVNSFLESNPDAINISFTTIQGLHSQLNQPRENSLTFEDFKAKNIVLISDEAHHINADTKAKKAYAGYLEPLSAPTWETTVERIFRSNENNILLEFTATMDMSDEFLSKKYQSKLIFDYPLREFRNDGFSKEVSVLQSDQPLVSRALQAILISQFRKMIFLDYEIIAKPVLLFKSKAINESEQFVEDFASLIRGLTIEMVLEQLGSDSNLYMQQINLYFREKRISLDNFVLQLQEDFSPSRCLVVNSKSDSEEKQLVVNSLEDPKNNYRVIFAVDKLNEGWDVLNLFDIVRLYDTRDAKDNKVGKTTMSEAQLIGRGARYYPFAVTSEQDRFTRKYDFDIENPLRLCETLLYHSSYNPKYLQELNSALQQIGIRAKESITQQLVLKEDFKESTTYKRGYLFINERIKRSDSDYPSFKDYVSSRVFKARLRTGWSKASNIFDAAPSDLTGNQSQKFDFRIGQLDQSIVRKAIARNKSYRFSNLIKYFPSLNSVTEFIESSEYLGSLSVEVNSPYAHLIDIPVDEILELLLQVLDDLATKLFSVDPTYFGSKEFKPVSIESVFRDKVMQFNIDENSGQEFGVSMNDSGKTSYHLDLSSRAWFAYQDFFGTSEEKLFVHYLDKQIESLGTRYKNIYVLRNEKFFKIYNFADGAATEPDFVLFLEGKSSQDDAFYQVFAEPKGDYLVANDSWKENLLLALEEDAQVSQLILGENHRVAGLPFYTNTNESEFDAAFKKLLMNSIIENSE